VKSTPGSMCRPWGIRLKRNVMRFASTPREYHLG
jgi:hypothetical protein